MFGRRRRGRDSAPDRQRLQCNGTSRNFLTTDPGAPNPMSYAGPASRGKRASDTRLVATPASPPAPSTAVAPRNHRVRPTERRSMVFAAGVLLGLAVGAGITLLVAPRSG